MNRKPILRSDYAAAYQYSRALMRQDMEQRGLTEALVLSDPLSAVCRCLTEALGLPPFRFPACAEYDGGAFFSFVSPALFPEAGESA